MLVGCSEKECVVKHPTEKGVFEKYHQELAVQCGLAVDMKLSGEEWKAIQLSPEECVTKFNKLNSWYHRFEKDNCY